MQPQRHTSAACTTDPSHSASPTRTIYCFMQKGLSCSDQPYSHRSHVGGTEAQARLGRLQILLETGLDDEAGLGEMVQEGHKLVPLTALHELEAYPSAPQSLLYRYKIYQQTSITTLVYITLLPRGVTSLFVDLIRSLGTSEIRRFRSASSYGTRPSQLSIIKREHSCT